jgi:hypothetical protein
MRATKHNNISSPQTPRPMVCRVRDVDAMGLAAATSRGAADVWHHDAVPDDEDIEALAREVADARAARWLSIIFAPEDPEHPWSVSIDEGRGTGATTAHARTLAEALRQRLTE